MLVLVCNVGSTSLKFKLYNMPQEELLVQAKIERVGDRGKGIYEFSAGKSKPILKAENVDIPSHKAGIDLFLKDLADPAKGNLQQELSAVGFKTVHAGTISGVQLLDDKVIRAMEEFITVVPMHNRYYIDAILDFQSLLPGTPLVGVFETSFHKTMPLEARLYSTPYSWYTEYGIQRYGFHGASHQYIASQVETLVGGTFRLVSCHLGGSSSLCAIKNGVSIDTSLGFSTQSGLPQSTRVGDLDAFVPLYLMKNHGFTADEILRDLASESGLAGVSGLSNDFRDLIEAAANGHERASLAIESYCYQAKKYIGGFAAALGGIDHLVFTGGIGENSGYIREKICAGLEFLGIAVDETRNRLVTDGVISCDRGPVRVAVIPTNEEVGIAREVYSKLK